MATPRCFFALVLVVALAIFCCATLTAAQSTDPVGVTITAHNSASAGGLIQFNIKANASVADSVYIQLTDANCPPADGDLFRRPNDGYGHVYWDSTCTTKNGYIAGFGVRDEDDCDISFDLMHLDKDDEVSCYLQWRRALETPATLSLTLDTDSSDSRVRLAAPIALVAPTPLDGVTNGYTLGDMTVKFVQGKDLLWPGAPKQMTQDKIVLEFANAKLRPFTQYSINELLVVDGSGDSTFFNILSNFDRAQLTNAYVAKDLRVMNGDGDHYILTAANPPSQFKIEFIYPNFLVQSYFQETFSMASVDEEKSVEQAPRRNNAQQRRGRRATAVAATGEEFKNFFAKRQQQIAALSMAQPSQHHVLQQSDLSFRIKAIVTPVVGDEEVVALSDAIPRYKYHELWPEVYPERPTISLPQANNATIALQRTFALYTTQQNVTIDLAMSGYEWGFKNAQELLMYYGTAGATAQLAYICGYASTPVPFTITTQSITGQCVTSGEDAWLRVTIIAAVPAVKALKPFRIPLEIDGRAAHFEFLPPLNLATEQPFTKFTNKELVFDVTGNYLTQLNVTGAGDLFAVVDIDTSVAFSTPVVYQWQMSNANYLTTDTLQCVAYNGQKKLSMQQHQTSVFFKDKKVDVTAKAGDVITTTCTAPINPNPKEGSHGSQMHVHTLINSQTVYLVRDEVATNPNEDWVELDKFTIFLEEGIGLEYVMTPAPKTVAEAKQRVLKLLNTAQWLEPPQTDNILPGLKNLTVSDVFLEWFYFRLNLSPKASTLTAANGVEKVMEFNKKFPAGQVFGGEDDRMSVYVYVNTTAAPGFSDAINALRFTALNRDEGFDLYTQNERTLGAEYEITTFDTADPAKRLPGWSSDQGWACSTVAQCDSPCVNGKCMSTNVPLVWIATDVYRPTGMFDDLSALYDAAFSTRGQNNAAFAVGGQNVYYVVAMAAIAIVAMMF